MLTSIELLMRLRCSRGRDVIGELTHPDFRLNGEPLTTVDSFGAIFDTTSKEEDLRMELATDVGFRKSRKGVVKLLILGAAMMLRCLVFSASLGSSNRRKRSTRACVTAY